MIKHDNFVLWSSWAFFGKELRQLTPEDKDEIEQIILHVENLSGHRFEPGLAEDLKCARLTLDPIFATQRPFLSYVLIAIANVLSHICLWLLGFRKSWKNSIRGQSM
jgi:hypothetical protein